MALLLEAVTLGGGAAIQFLLSIAPTISRIPSCLQGGLLWLSVFV